MKFNLEKSEHANLIEEEKADKENLKKRLLDLTVVKRKKKHLFECFFF